MRVRVKEFLQPHIVERIYNFTGDYEIFIESSRSKVIRFKGSEYNCYSDDGKKHSPYIDQGISVADFRRLLRQGILEIITDN